MLPRIILILLILVALPSDSKIKKTSGNTNLIFKLLGDKIEEGHYVQIQLSNDVLIDGYKVFAKETIGKAKLEKIDHDLFSKSCKIKLSGAKINDVFNNIHFINFETEFLSNCKDFRNKELLAKDSSPVFFVVSEHSKARKNVSWDLK